MDHCMYPSTIVMHVAHTTALHCMYTTQAVDIVYTDGEADSLIDTNQEPISYRLIYVTSSAKSQLVPCTVLQRKRAKLFDLHLMTSKQKLKRPEY